MLLALLQAPHPWVRPCRAGYTAVAPVVVGTEVQLVSSLFGLGHCSFPMMLLTQLAGRPNGVESTRPVVWAAPYGDPFTLQTQELPGPSAGGVRPMGNLT